MLYGYHLGLHHSLVDDTVLTQLGRETDRVSLEQPTRTASPTQFSMASAVFIINQKGEQLVTRHFRSDISNSSINAFRTQVPQ